jgi:GT2 family glycosyltransferase
MRPETSVIILNWNGVRLLPECLSALAAQSYRDFDLWLVDNGSIDGSDRLLTDLEQSVKPSWLESPLPTQAHIIRNLDNTGFAGGNNLAIRESGSRFVVALNNDAMPEPRWLESLVDTAKQAGPQVGMVASTMLFAHRPDIVASAGLSIHRDGLALDRAMGLPAKRVEGFGTRPVFGPSAGAALYTRSLLNDVGLFDERFFSYLEDADLAWRARLRGWRALHNPEARVRHVYSATGGQESPFKRRLISRNRIWTIYKNMPEVLLRCYSAAIFRYDLLAVLRGVAVRDRWLIAGRMEALGRLGRFTLDRRKIVTSARVPPDVMSGFFAPAMPPLLALKYRNRLNYILSGGPPEPIRSAYS